jgi:hypothetical protein
MSSPQVAVAGAKPIPNLVTNVGAGYRPRPAPETKGDPKHPNISEVDLAGLADLKDENFISISEGFSYLKSACKKAGGIFHDASLNCECPAGSIFNEWSEQCIRLEYQKDNHDAEKTILIAAESEIITSDGVLFQDPPVRSVRPFNVHNLFKLKEGFAVLPSQFSTPNAAVCEQGFTESVINIIGREHFLRPAQPSGELLTSLFGWVKLALYTLQENVFGSGIQTHSRQKAFSWSLAPKG